MSHITSNADVARESHPGINEDATLTASVFSSFSMKGLYAYGVVLFISAVLSFRYVAARNAFADNNKGGNARRCPPTTSYIFPFLRSMLLGYLFNSSRFVLDREYVTNVS